MTFYEEFIQNQRESFKRLFKRREMKNPVTAVSVITKYHQFQERLIYPFGVPPNLIQPQTIVAIIKKHKT